MKYIYYNLLALSLIFISCKKQEVTAYDQSDRVNFGTSDVVKTVRFSSEADFIDGKDSIFVTISAITMGKKNGNKANLYFKQIVDVGTVDTANVRVWRNPLLIDYTKSNYVDSIVVRRPKKPKAVHTVKIEFDFNKSSSFSKGAVETQYSQINVTDQFAEPSWWSAYLTTFGSFSDAKYRLMLRVTKDVRFYSTSAKRTAAVTNSKVALTAYNVANPGKPLMDDATPVQPISFP